MVTDEKTLLRSVKPDFLLVRQNLRDANENHKKLLLGFRYSSNYFDARASFLILFYDRYAGLPSVNSVESIYNFQV